MKDFKDFLIRYNTEGPSDEVVNDIEEIISKYAKDGHEKQLALAIASTSELTTMALLERYHRWSNGEK